MQQQQITKVPSMKRAAEIRAEWDAAQDAAVERAIVKARRSAVHAAYLVQSANDFLKKV